MTLQEMASLSNNSSNTYEHSSCHLYILNKEFRTKWIAKNPPCIMTPRNLCSSLFVLNLRYAWIIGTKVEVLGCNPVSLASLNHSNPSRKAPLSRYAYTKIFWETPEAHLVYKYIMEVLMEVCDSKCSLIKYQFTDFL